MHASGYVIFGSVSEGCGEHFTNYADLAGKRIALGLTSDTRLVLVRKVDGVYVGERIMQIITVPAELGYREGLEMMVEDYRPAENAA